jgi:signal transduction histidine kinase
VGLLSRQFLSGIALKLELDRDLPAVRTSRGKLEQILLNLIVNASEAMEGKGSLRIAVRRQKAAGSSLVVPASVAPEYIEVLVADSGPGMAPEILARIFEPFFTTKNIGATRGTGLGLSMVHTMAEQEGLGIAVKTTIGKGTEFRLYVPS